MRCTWAHWCGHTHGCSHAHRSVHTLGITTLKCWFLQLVPHVVQQHVSIPRNPGSPSENCFMKPNIPMRLGGEMYIPIILWRSVIGSLGIDINPLQIVATDFTDVVTPHNSQQHWGLVHGCAGHWCVCHRSSPSKKRWLLRGDFKMDHSQP